MIQALSGVYRVKIAPPARPLWYVEQDSHNGNPQDAAPWTMPVAPVPDSILIGIAIRVPCARRSSARTIAGPAGFSAVPIHHYRIDHLVDGRSFCDFILVAETY
jgi:hypothetical protein